MCTRHSNVAQCVFDSRQTHRELVMLWMNIMRVNINYARAPSFCGFITFSFQSARAGAFVKCFFTCYSVSQQCREETKTIPVQAKPSRSSL